MFLELSILIDICQISEFCPSYHLQPIDMYLYLDSASVVMVEAGSTSHFRMAAMLNGPT